MIRELLPLQSIFVDIPEDKIDRIHEAGDTVVLTKGEILVQDGDRLENIYFILEGEVDILVPDDLEEYEDLSWINMLLEGDCIGEYSFVDDQPASATVRARIDTTLFRLSHDKLREFLDADDAFRAQIYKNLLESLVQRLRNTNIYIDYLQRANSVRRTN